MNHKINIPFIEQHQKTECGLCCIAMISSYYKHEISLKELSQQHETGRDGTSFLQIVEILDNIGFTTKSFKFPKEEHAISKIITPAIALWDSKHFVVIEKITSKYYYVIDPEIGKLRYTFEEFTKHFSNFVVSVYGNSSISRKKYKEDNSKIYKLIFESWHFLLLLGFLTALSYLITFIFPIGISTLINRISVNKNISLMPVFWLIMIFSTIYFIASLLQKNSSVKVTSEIDKRLNYGVVSRLFKLPYKFYSNRSRGDLVYSLNGLTRIRELFANQFLLGSLDFGLTICILIYMLNLHIIIFELSAILLLLNFTILFLTRQNLDQKNRLLIVAQNKLQNKQIEIIYSMMGIKMEGFEEEVFSQWDESYSKYIYRYKHTQKYSAFINSLFELISFVSPFLILLVTAYLYLQNQINLGLLFSVYSFETILFGRVNNVFNTVLGYINSKSFISRANEIMSEEEEKQVGRKVEVKGNIKLDKVSFSYTKNSEVVIKNISMKIPEGKKVAIVGASGSGKSTLSKLLMGLYTPTSGKIYYDDVDEEELDKKFLRKQIGIVPQDMTLFNKTIFENIVGDGEYSEDIVFKACKISNIHEEIMKMPMGYNTLVSEMGMNLSGGQRQRIILARAIVKNPKIILLDEATSYLDNINEKSIMDNFKQRGITTIVIAHRLSTIIDSDKIFVLDSGCIKESGTHEELMKQTGVYYNMYNLEESK